MNLGVFGGSFNPIHLGHLILAEQMREHFALEKVLFIPAKEPPHKRNHALAPAADRREMVRLAVAGNEAFEVSDIELRREGASYTIDTIQELQRRFGAGAELHFIIGSDTVRELPTWHRVGELLRLCEFVIGARPGHEARVREHLSGILSDEELSALEARTVTIRLIQISATDIRERVRSGRSIRYLVPSAVEEYIAKRGLYQ